MDGGAALNRDTPRDGSSLAGINLFFCQYLVFSGAGAGGMVRGQAPGAPSTGRRLDSWRVAAVASTAAHASIQPFWHESDVGNVGALRHRTQLLSAAGAVGARRERTLWQARHSLMARAWSSVC